MNPSRYLPFLVRIRCGTHIALLVVLALISPACRPNGPKLLIRGDQLLQEGRPAEAVKAIEEAVQQMPGEARAWNHLGLAYHANHNADAARKAYLKALELNRNLVVAQYNLANLELENGRNGEAEKGFKSFIDWNQNSGEAWAKLAIAQQRLQAWDAAESSARTAIGLNEHDAESWNTLGVVQIQKRKTRDAYQSFLRAQKEQPQHPQSLLNLALTVHHQLKDPRSALIHYRNYATLNPEPSDAESIRADVQTLRKQR